MRRCGRCGRACGLSGVTLALTQRRPHHVTRNTQAHNGDKAECMHPPTPPHEEVLGRRHNPFVCITMGGSVMHASTLHFVLGPDLVNLAIVLLLNHTHSMASPLDTPQHQLRHSTISLSISSWDLLLLSTAIFLKGQDKVTRLPFQPICTSR